MAYRLFRPRHQNAATGFRASRLANSTEFPIFEQHAGVSGGALLSPRIRLDGTPFVGCAAPEPLIYDIDAAGDVDILDTRGISARRGAPALPGEPADIDGDGVITVGDARNCVYECTLSRCAIP